MSGEEGMVLSEGSFQPRFMVADRGKEIRKRSLESVRKSTIQRHDKIPVNERIPPSVK